MNNVVLMGRLTKDPETRYTEEQLAVSRFTLAVDRRRRKDGEQTADFIPCIAFGKQGEFCEKYLARGTKIALVGHIQTGSYKNRDGATVYTTDVIADHIEFAESKAAGTQAPAQQTRQQTPDIDGFMNIPDGLDDELPFA